ncbi:aspartate aminotransferase family protein [Chloroflexota bacterium]
MQKQKDCVFYPDLNRTYIPVERGEGRYIYDVNGKKYFDAGSGHIAAIGHGVKEVYEAMYQQAQKVSYVHPFLQLTNQPKVELANKIIEHAPKGMSRAVFFSGGSEANEGALRLARIYHMLNGNSGKFKILARMNSFAGATMATLALGWRSYRRYFSHSLPSTVLIPPNYCYRCPWDKEYPSCNMRCAWELDTVIKREGPDNIAAFICEPVPGLGVGVPPKEYFPIIREICDKHNVLMITDEVITGFGRLGGKFFGIEHWGVCPDIITTAKGMAAGYTPLSALIVSEKVVDCLSKGAADVGHVAAHTYAGNPASCAGGLAVLNYIVKNNLVQRCEEMSEYLFKKLSPLNNLSIVGDIRGKGLIIGIEFVADKESKEPLSRKLKVSENIAANAMEKGLFVLPAPGFIDGELGDGLLVVPALTVTEDECDNLVDLLAQSIEETQSQVKR